MLVHAYTEYFGNDRFATTTLTDLCYTASRSRSSHRYRLALAVRSMAELRERLEALDAGLCEPTFPVYSTMESWHNHAGAAAPLRAAAAAFVATGTLDLRTLYADCSPRIADLPGYRFDERRCWIDFPAQWGATGQAIADATRSDPIAHSVEWALDESVPEPVDDLYAQVLALLDPATEAETMLRSAGFSDARVLRLHQASPAGPGAAADPEDRPYTEGDGTPYYERIAELAVDGGFTHLVYALAFEDGPAADVTELDRRVRKNLHGLFLLVQALMTAGASLHLAVLTNRALAAVPGEAGIATDNGALAGLAKAIEREYPYITVSCIDLDASVPPRLVRDEILAGRPGVTVLRAQTRLREHFAELPVIEAATTEGQDGKGGYLRAGGTYLITGGTGGIGLETCRVFAAQQPDINLVLLSRSGAPPREQWHASPTALAAALHEIEELGARVEVLVADAGEPAALTEAVTAVQRRHGRIDGIVHAAGIPGERVIAFRTEDEFAAVIRPKIYGAYMLDALTAHDRPDFIAYFSSVAALFPTNGQADYAAANYYLDNLARARAGGPSHVIAFDWVAWKETGMAVATGANMDTIFKALPTEPGLTVLDTGLRSDHSRVFGGQVHYDGDFVQVLPSYHVGLDPAIEAKIDDAAQARAERRERAASHVRERILSVEVKLTGRPDGRYTPAEELVARCWAEMFGYAEIDVDADFFDLGGDSITAISLMTTVTMCTGVELNAADLLVERSVASLARLAGESSLPGTDQPAALGAGSSAAFA
jgi:NAD(P)-dependent dehydrogenase (short-subunit alcohol dehydrogenase family)/acyl carrier protein